MRQSLKSFFCISLLLLSLMVNGQEANTLYTLENIKQDFTRMKNAGINLDEKHKWHFIFSASSEDSLSNFAYQLVEFGLTPVTILKKNHYELIVESNKVYTPELMYSDTQLVEKKVNDNKHISFQGISLVE